MAVKNALTIDVEDWYQGNDFDLPFHTWPGYQERIWETCGPLLDLLAAFRVRATFFVLGYIAERHPDLVRALTRAGHELGVHGYSHTPVGRLGPAGFREEVRRSRALLEDLTGEQVRAFRAPSWSITHRTIWALEVLAEEGFAYDSSIFPVGLPFFGISRAPVAPHRLPGIPLAEFPPSVLQLRTGVRIPFSGGFFLRAAPWCLIRQGIRHLNAAGQPALVYLHPWELDPRPPRIPASPPARFVHYYRLGSTEHKLRRLLSNFSFVPAGEILRSHSLID